jgi:hypothetical protein
MFVFSRAELTPLSGDSRIGVNEIFSSKKEGQPCKVEKRGANP